jgi:hypothetical protein
MGVENLTTIEYMPDKVAYHYVYYLSGGGKDNYTIIMFLKDNIRLKATFVPSESGGEIDRLASVDMQNMDGNRVTKDTSYFLDDNTVSLAKSNGITVGSTADDIINFINNNNPSPSTVADYQYYKDTQVVFAETLSLPDQSGNLQPVTQNFGITEKDGYYIQQASAG